ncbi:MAG: helix-turn-helix transcriptional regulator [Pseudomonadota bacterium]
MNKTDFHQLDEHIGLCLRRLRNRKHYSLEQVAEWLNLSKQQVSRLEHGKSRMSIVQLYQIARGFNIPISWFFEEFKDDINEVKWVSNMVREDRAQWQPSNKQDQTKKLLALWNMVDNQQLQQQIVHLLEAITEMKISVNNKDGDSSQ